MHIYIETHKETNTCIKERIMIFTHQIVCFERTKHYKGFVGRSIKMIVSAKKLTVWKKKRGDMPLSCVF